MAIGACLRAGDPFALAVVQGGLSVQRDGRFQSHPGFALAHALQKADVEFLRKVSAWAHRHFYTCRSQLRKTLSGHQRVGVLQACHHLSDAGLDQGLGARACAPTTGAGLQRHPGGGVLWAVSALLGVPQGHDFGMGAAHRLRVALADHLALRVGQHTAHARVGRGQKQRRSRQAQCQTHGLGQVADMGGVQDTPTGLCQREMRGQFKIAHVRFSLSHIGL
jgi:hypothetical protein